MTAHIVDAVREAGSRGAGLRVTAAATWLDAGRPAKGTSSESISLSSHTGIVEYEPGDLTLTARAGTPLSEIESATRANAQFLALDPFGSPLGTIGATVATASYGPLGHSFGGPRDATIGLQFVTGDGLVARGGGRVVKNVAGFDLVRLLIGSWGTLGIVTEVSLRLRALPEADETLAIAVPEGEMGVSELVGRLRVAPLAPWSAELVNAELAGAIGLEERPLLLLRIAGSEQSVSPQLAAARALGDALTVPGTVWNALREFEIRQQPDAVLRVSSKPSLIADVWTRALAIASRTRGMAHATVGRGVARVSLKGSVDELREAFAANNGFKLIYERLPAALWQELAPAVADDRLSRALRTRFDPHQVLNPGLMGSH